MAVSLRKEYAEFFVIYSEFNPRSGVATGTILGAIASGGSDGTFFQNTPASTWILSGALGGLGWGAAIGALTLAFKHPRLYSINGDPAKWKAFLNRPRPRYQND